MGIALFMTFIFLHIAFGLAIAFFVMYFASKAEHKGLKNLGYVVGYLLIVLAVITMILSAIFVAKKPHFMPCPHPFMNERMRHEKMMEHGMPMMQKQQEEQQEEIQEQKSENKNMKNIAYKVQLKKQGKGCPVKTKKEIEKELKQGKRTGAACHADMKEIKKVQK